MKTPNYPLYKDARDKAPHEYPPSGNTGLWFTRFFNQYDNKFIIYEEYKDEEKRPRSPKLKWLQDIVKNDIGNGKQIKDLNDRQRKLCDALRGNARTFETEGSFVTGMGLSHPVENGFTFHPTLGVPYLPASSVKGLLRGWVEEWMEHSTEPEKNTLIARWFGAAKGNEEGMKESAGELIFFDALPTKPVHLGCEIMTPHMGKWYEKGDENNPPADWYSPVPVPFLVVSSGVSFEFMVAPRTDNMRGEIDKVMKQLSDALTYIGAGAKTATGYGRMKEKLPIIWLSAKIKFNAKNKTLSAEYKEFPSIHAIAPEGERLLQTLPPATQAKIKRNEFVKAKVTLVDSVITQIEAT